MSGILTAQALAAVREAVRRRARGRASIRSGDLVAWLAEQPGIGQRLVACAALETMRDDGEIACAWVPGVGPSGMVTVSLPAQEIGDAEARWREAVASRLHPDDPRTAGFHAIWPKINDWPPDRHIALVEELLFLSAHGRSGDRAGYRLSASGRLASSKLLNALPRAALLAAGFHESATREPPPYLIAATPDAGLAVTVLVENPEAFEAAVEASVDLPVAWLSVYGFGISRTDGAGARLVDSLADRGGPILLQRRGPAMALQTILAAPLVTFFGDLDFAGLQIHASLSSTLPHLSLSRMYAPLAALLASGGGHPYAAATGEGKPRQRSCTSGDPLINRLLALCARAAADQEHLSADAIRAHCLHPLTMKDLSW